MAYNKVEANGRTLINLTSDTVTADTLLSGRTAHLASGVPVTGTFEPVTGVKGNAESAYRKGNVNLTPANIGAATSEQGAKADSAVQTIQIGGTAQAKTNGTVNLPAYPTKSSLGLGNVDNTSDANKPISTAQQTALNGKVSKAGDTMTGELKTSFNCVANGSIAIESKVGGFPVTLPNFIDVIRYSSGCSGSAQFSAYTLDDITIPSGWYNFEWLSHRTGGVNGAASGDNCNYGTLILTGMSVKNAAYIVRYSSQVITEVHELYKGEDISDCLYIEAYNAGTAITIQNTSDFTLNLFTKFSVSDQIPKFAFLRLSSSGKTYYLRAMINIKSASVGTSINVSFIDEGTTLYIFNWSMQSGTLGTPTITAKTLA